jgi:hypothetical protein
VTLSGAGRLKTGEKRLSRLIAIQTNEAPALRPIARLLKSKLSVIQLDRDGEKRKNLELS